MTTNKISFSAPTTITVLDHGTIKSVETFYTVHFDPITDIIEYSLSKLYIMRADDNDMIDNTINVQEEEVPAANLEAFGYFMSGVSAMIRFETNQPKSFF